MHNSPKNREELKDFAGKECYTEITPGIIPEGHTIVVAGDMKRGYDQREGKCYMCSKTVYTHSKDEDNLRKLQPVCLLCPTCYFSIAEAHHQIT